QVVNQLLAQCIQGRLGLAHLEGQACNGLTAFIGSQVRLMAGDLSTDALDVGVKACLLLIDFKSSFSRRQQDQFGIFFFNDFRLCYSPVSFLMNATAWLHCSTVNISQWHIRLLIPMPSASH